MQESHPRMYEQRGGTSLGSTYPVRREGKMRILFVVMAITLSSIMLCPKSYGQKANWIFPIERNIAVQDRQEVVRRVKEARNLIEKEGERIFNEFRKPGSKWNDQTYAIFLSEATGGSPGEGDFVVYPFSRFVGKDALDMKHVNGKPFVVWARQQVKERPVIVWMRDWDQGTGWSPVTVHAATLAQTPGGKSYVVASGSSNLAMELHFLEEIVDAASNLVREEGAKAFPVFRSKRSIFRFKDTFVYVVDLEGNILVDPRNPSYEGRKKITDLHASTVAEKNLPAALHSLSTGSKSTSLIEYLRHRRNLIEEYGFVWGAYRIPSKKENAYRRIISFARFVKGPDGKEYVVGTRVPLADLVHEN